MCNGTQFMTHLSAESQQDSPDAQSPLYEQDFPRQFMAHLSSESQQDSPVAQSLPKAHDSPVQVERHTFRSYLLLQQYCEDGQSESEWHSLKASTRESTTQRARNMIEKTVSLFIHAIICVVKLVRKVEICFDYS
jgi:hypothetical protein